MKIYLYLIIMIIPLIARADEVYLRDGEVLKGSIINVDSEIVKITLDDKKTSRDRSDQGFSENAVEKTVIIKREDVRRLVYDDGKDVNLSDGDETNNVERDKKKFDGKNNPDNTSGQDYIFSLSAGINKMSGNTTYQIGGNIDTPEGSGKLQFPLSELKFPLNVYMVSFEGDIDFFEKFKTGIKINKNITKEAGTMEDSDWGVPFEYPYLGSGDLVWYGPDHKDIYSKSDSSLDALIMDINFMYRFVNMTSARNGLDISFFGGLGYLYQKFNFECVLIHQWDLRPDVPADQNADSNGDGSVALKYSVRSDITYINIAVDMIIHDRYFFNAEAGYSPYVKVRDRDNHVLRDKISKARCEGTAKMFSVCAGFFIERPLFIKLNFEYLSVDTEGRQKQYDTGEYSGTIDQKNFGTRKNVEISTGIEL